MREITYIIDDKKGFERILKKEDLDEKDFFQVKYTLTKDASGITYKLVDFKNNSININSLNGYQQMYTNECFASFAENRDVSDDFKDYITIDNTIHKELEFEELERE